MPAALAPLRDTPTEAEHLRLGGDDLVRRLAELAEKGGEDARVARDRAHRAGASVLLGQEGLHGGLPLRGVQRFGEEVG